MKDYIPEIRDMSIIMAMYVNASLDAVVLS